VKKEREREREREQRKEILVGLFEREGGRERGRLTRTAETVVDCPLGFASNSTYGKIYPQSQ
jgi:hypothetical protein